MTLKDELLTQGIQAYQAGDLASAAAIFTQLVKQLPDEDQGWLWLGKTLPSPERKQFCFQRAIQLNPANAEAGHLLVQLSRPDRQAPVSAPIQQGSPGSPIPAARPFVPAQQPAAPPSAPPFLMEAQKPEPVPEQAQGTSAVETAASPSPAVAIPVQKVPRSRLLPTIGLVVGVGICVLGVFLIVSMDLLSDLGALLPLSPLPTQAQLPTSLPATAGQPTRTATISPVPQASPTPSLAARLPTVAYTPAYRSVPCTFDAPTGVVVNCGRLTVPENRADPGSDSIELAVAVFRSTAADPEPDPVLFLQGGPGGEAVMLSANAFSILVEPFLAARDFIAVDQRGTGLSEPALGCEELTDVYQQDIHGRIPASSRGFIFENAFRSCHGMMAISGIDLSAYTTYESAADLRDLVSALGYTQVNVYGASYGTRLAQVLMREHPAVVRSAILDSVVPLDVSLYATDEVRFTNALNQLFTVCRNDQACNRDYPGLETVFWDLVAALNTEPVTVTAPLLTGGEITEDLAGTDLLNITLAMLKQTDLIASVPQSIYRIQAGDYSTFVAAQSSLPFAFEGIDIGLYISMMCHEHILTSTITELQAAFDGAMDLGLYSRLPFMGEAADLFDTCELWGAEAPRVGENDPLVSDIPSLVIEGAFDPTTPPLFGQRILPGLSRATYVEFPNQGHVPTAMDASGCAMEIVQDFLAAPGQTPDSDCVEDSREVGFVLPYTGTPAEVLTGYAGNGFRASRPAGWQEIWDGIFLRDNSPLDITQIALMRTYGTSEELLDSLSSKLYGYQGFDTAPLQTGTRQENGLSWSLYRTSSYGRPVELAMADDQGSAIIILLFCHVDEREALVETVFLPMIDSVVPEP